MLFALALGSALAAPAGTWRYDVHYLGSRVGWVEAAEVETATGARLTRAEARSSRWYRPVYNLHDRILTTWTQRGTQRYQAWLREGRYHHDLDQRFSSDGIVVDNRRQEKGDWRTWTDALEPSPGAFDPVAALLQVARRAPSEPAFTVPVFSGRETKPLRAQRLEVVTESHPVLGPVRLLSVDLTTRHRDEIAKPGRFVVWVADLPDPVLARAVLKTPVGAVRVELVDGPSDAQSR